MELTVKAKEFRETFQNSLKITARSISVKTLLSERNLRRIDYSPYYQRNFVWDNTKQTFFIESVILGTEVPPLILFKTGAKIEVIDGRQRFETLKRFKENSFPLSSSGLKELQTLSKQTFNKLTEVNKEIFLNSNIRIFEFEVINPNLDDDLIDRVKKEIFRRYNTGITPLTSEELDNAKYDADEFSELFKKELKSNILFLKKFNDCFSPKVLVNDNPNNNDGLIAENVDQIRRFRVLKSFPIYTYASGTSRSEIMDLLYDFVKNNTDNFTEEYEKFYETLETVLAIFESLKEIEPLNNRLIYECVLWALTILKDEGIPISFDKESFISHYTTNIHLYSDDNSYFYKPTILRYTDTAQFFNKLTKFDFSKYVKDPQFKERIAQLRQTPIEAAKSIEELSNLRLNKPNPISTPVDEIRNDLKSTRYVLRPSYQRQEKISLFKASAIIESILLGINLPPIFIHKKMTGMKEVVDGQQRLLAIIGFLGEQFNNEDGNLTYSKNNNFKLKGLKILDNLEGKNFSSLTIEQQDKILDFVVDIIIIEESINAKFDPIDLFIRLNYKPYPIKNNSFEMWNSIVNNEVIKKIKDVTNDPVNDWFFLREQIDGKPDRMLNEELITILAYMSFSNQLPIRDGVIGFYQRQDRITCRLKNKKALGDFLLNLDNVANEKNEFLLTIERTRKTILNCRSLFDSTLSKEQLNDFLNVKETKIFRRSLQDFYIIWLIMDVVPADSIEVSKPKILADIRKLLSLVKNTSNSIVNESYLNEFHQTIEEIIASHSTKAKS